MLIVNGNPVNLSGSSKLAKKITEGIKFLKEEVSENGRHVVFVYCDHVSKPIRIKKEGGSFYLRPGYPANTNIEMVAYVGTDEGTDEWAFTKRARKDYNFSAMDNRDAKQQYPRHEFTGREVVDLNKEPDKAYFMYFCSPHCEGGANSKPGGNIIFRVFNRRKDAIKSLESRKARTQAETMITWPYEQGGLSMKDLIRYAKSLYMFDADKTPEEILREDVWQKVEEKKLYLDVLKDIDMEGRDGCRSIATNALSCNVIKLYDDRGKKAWCFIGEEGRRGDLIVEIPIKISNNGGMHVLSEKLFKDIKVREEVEKLIEAAENFTPESEE